MTPESRPPRVRVTRPYRTRTPLRRTTASEIDAQTEIGLIYMRSLIRSQLRLAMLTLLALALTVGALPLVLTVFPGLTDVHVIGMPLPWVILGFAVYPWFVLLAWRYVRASERQESAFTQVVERP